jgi:GNAT superfamily N-acetyltransferase
MLVTNRPQKGGNTYVSEPIPFAHIFSVLLYTWCSINMCRSAALINLSLLTLYLPSPPLDIKHLMVHPAYQRRGIGARLLEHVIKSADAKGVPTFLVSSAEAHRLYLNLDFRDLGTWVIDNATWTKRIVAHELALGIRVNEALEQTYADATEIECYMVRWPKE